MWCKGEESRFLSGTSAWHMKLGMGKELLPKHKERELPTGLQQGQAGRAFPPPSTQQTEFKAPKFKAELLAHS